MSASYSAVSSTSPPRPCSRAGVVVHSVSASASIIPRVSSVSGACSETISESPSSVSSVPIRRRGHPSGTRARTGRRRYIDIEPTKLRGEPAGELAEGDEADGAAGEATDRLSDSPLPLATLDRAVERAVSSAGKRAECERVRRHLLEVTLRDEQVRGRTAARSGCCPCRCRPGPPLSESAASMTSAVTCVPASTINASAPSTRVRRPPALSPLSFRRSHQPHPTPPPVSPRASRWCRDDDFV